jgi:hypothetical protein
MFRKIHEWKVTHLALVVERVALGIRELEYVQQQAQEQAEPEEQVVHKT